MTSKQKIRILLLTAVVIFFGLGIVTNYVFPHNVFLSMVGFIISIVIIFGLYTKIRTKEEIREYNKLHTKIFNFGGRLFGICSLIIGIISLWSFLQTLIGMIQGHIVIDDTNRVTFIVSIFVPIFLIIIGYAFIRAEEYKPRDIEPLDENRSDNQHERVDPLRQMLREQEEQEGK